MASWLTWKKLRIGAIVLLLAVIAALLLFPWQTKDVLERCQDLYERGEYAACSRALAGKMRRDPDWHEGRELLIKAQLAGNDPLAATFWLLFWRVHYFPVDDGVHDCGQVVKGMSLNDDQVSILAHLYAAYPVLHPQDFRGINGD